MGKKQFLGEFRFISYKFKVNPVIFFWTIINTSEFFSKVFDHSEPSAMKYKCQ